jgi:transcriptional regulator with XRE-family HTH domain
MVRPRNKVKREWLKEHRKEKKKTVEEIAEIFGISKGHYSDIENGRRNPSVDLSLEIASFFNFSVEKLLQDRAIFKRGESE